MFCPNLASSGIQVVVIKELTAHCKGALFLYVAALDYTWLCALNVCFYFGVLELDMFVLWFVGCGCLGFSCWCASFLCCGPTLRFLIVGL
jgi:hypothetical protein